MASSEDHEAVREHPEDGLPLAPYYAIIHERLMTYPELSAVRLFDECRAAGFPGSYTLLKEFIRRVRSRPEPEPVIRFETAPEHQAQVDFAECQFLWGSAGR